MSESQTNPYSFRPEPIDESLSAVTDVPQTAPWTLLAVAICFCLFGLFGAASLPLYLVTRVFQGWMSVATMSANGPEVEMAAKFQALVEDFAWANFLQSVLDSVIGIVFVISGILLLLRRPRGVSLGLLGIYLSIPTELMRSGVAFLLIVRQSSIFAELASMDNQPAGEMGGVMSSFMMVFGIIFLVLMILLRIGYFGFCYSVLKSKRNRAYLGVPLNN